MHCGDDVRYAPMQSGIDKKYGISVWKNTKGDFFTFIRNFWFVWVSEKTADQIISARDQATFQSIPYNFFTFPMGKIKMSKNFESNKLIKIIHAPSNRSIKGLKLYLNQYNS